MKDKDYFLPVRKEKLEETASYNKIVQNEGDFDDIPDNYFSTQSGYPSPENPGLSSTLYEEDKGGDEELEPPMEAPPESPPEAESEDQTVNELQNEIIRYNIETLKSLHSEIKNLGASIDGLNRKFDELNRDVEEVREPTNVEKLVQKKDVSYPYYFNLNDFWKGNWFEKLYKGDDGVTKDGSKQVGAIKQLPDGSFVADFDDLPEDSFIDIEKSFHDIV